MNTAIFDINYSKLLRLLLPTMLRRRTLLALLSPPFSYINRLHQAFRANREVNLYNLQITPQICYLEKMLNDRYDVSARNIYIKDSYTDYKPGTYIYIDAENKQLPIFLDSENRPKYLFDSSEMSTGGIDFIVCVPDSVAFDMEEMKALVNAYKLASKTFSIIKY
jgi:hypothetical protein